MFRSLAILVAILHLYLVPTIRAQGPQDEQAIHAIIQAHATAWNNRNAVAAAAVLTPDGVWITSSGDVLRGRAALERAHRDWLADDSAQGGSVTLFIVITKQDRQWRIAEVRNISQ